MSSLGMSGSRVVNFSGTLRMDYGRKEVSGWKNRVVLHTKTASSIAWKASHR